MNTFIVESKSNGLSGINKFAVRFRSNEYVYSEI